MKLQRGCSWASGRRQMQPGSSPCSTRRCATQRVLQALPAPSRRHALALPKAAANGEVGPRKGKKGAGKVPPADSNGAPGSTSSATAVAAPHAAPLQAAEEVEQLLEELDDDQGQQLAAYMDAVVKVYCIHTEPNYSLPWQRKRQYSSSSSGFVVRWEGRNWLLTNAHSVDYHTQVKVKRRGDDRKFLARVLSIGVDCDIALLEVEDSGFWEGLTPLELGPLPRLQDGVAVVGYPIGGDTISVTAGVVSRIEVTDYSHGSTDLLAVQIDAAINGGNSGGPVFNRECKCVGIAFQALVGEDVENVGYVIPTPVVHHFLTDFQRTGTFSGFPALGVQWQRMESEALRQAYGMSDGQKGVLVRGINPTSAAAAALKLDDVILSFDDVEISNDGTVPFRTGERIAFSSLVSNKYVGDTCKLLLLRGGKPTTETVTLSKPQPLIPPHIYNRDPSYLLVGGLVFTVACEPYLQSEYGSDYGSDSPVKLLDRLYHGFPQQAGEEVVVLSQVLACDATLGYEEVYNVQLLRFNGQPVHSLHQLAQLAASCTDDFMRFDLDYNEVVVIESGTVREATAEVMRSHSIPYDRSGDLRAVAAAHGQQHATEAAAAAEAAGQPQSAVVVGQ